MNNDRAQNSAIFEKIGGKYREITPPEYYRGRQAYQVMDEIAGKLGGGINHAYTVVKSTVFMGVTGNYLLRHYDCDNGVVELAAVSRMIASSLPFVESEKAAKNVTESPLGTGGCKEQGEGTQLTLFSGIFASKTIADMIPGKSWFLRNNSSNIYCRIGDKGAIGVSPKSGVYYFSLGGKIPLTESVMEIQNIDINFNFEDKK